MGMRGGPDCRTAIECPGSTRFMAHLSDFAEFGTLWKPANHGALHRLMPSWPGARGGRVMTLFNNKLATNSIREPGVLGIYALR